MFIFQHIIIPKQLNCQRFPKQHTLYHRTQNNSIVLALQ